MNPGAAADPVDASDRSAILAGLAAVEQRIERACQRAGRDRDGVMLLPVTKTVPAARVAVALAGGYRAIGENRVQEAVAKRAELADWQVEWHLVGHLQRNKVKQALEFADWIQSIDRGALVERLARKLEERGETRRVLLQVNTSGAESQFGVAPAEAAELAAAIAAESSLDLRGLMTIGRLVEDAEDARDCFVMLRELRDRLQDELGRALPVLSMGMSADLEVAVEEGATLVRIGSAIFGARPPEA